ncbi:pyrroloquinoline quinone biosynthesis protein PqqE [Legionella yabuuchiae]|uniref:pyrroloquinoline quinone biosynthesis protein PqqE n=1 Tax=Legionella yabuuchiae TaxID=376727 RepID=UPI0010545DFA|nr:pyrroloquinoline quinone biosynthesis protein PqqE [Legionella yabuuchiae]
MLAFPKGILLELTHRCPLHCPYCSNPIELIRKAQELSADIWLSVIEQAAQLSVQQLHFSGGEPLLYPNILHLLQKASDLGVYANLITSGINLTSTVAKNLKKTGIPHVQLSIQGPGTAYDLTLSGYKKAFEHKSRAVSALLTENISVTINWVMCRQNIDALPEVLAQVLDWGVPRLELAMTQYHGWAHLNRAALFPTAEQVHKAEQEIIRAQKKHRGHLVIDYVPSDYALSIPKPCMGGWGQKLMVINPQGEVLPCHMAKLLPLTFENVHEKTLLDIWQHSSAFNQYRGTDWMPMPCKTCPQKTIDWGGCRCQAFALTGDASATDPVCRYAPTHALTQIANLASPTQLPQFRGQHFRKKKL